VRVTQLMLSKGFGGAERSFVDLCLALADAGHEVQALCHERFVARPRLAGRSDLALGTVNARGLWDRWSLIRLERLVRDFRPALVHAHLARGAWAAGHVGRRTGVPVVVKTHNYVKLKYYRQVDRFIPTTRDQARYLRHHGIGEARIERIPNFCAMDPAAAARRPPARGARVLTYGRMVAKKGFHDLLEAFARVRAAGVDATLVVGGDGPERARLERAAAAPGLAGAVRFAGWIDDVPEALAQADLFVLPSRDEPFGIVALEAMAGGVPVVTTRTQGPREVLDEATARFAEVADVPSLAAALAAALADPAASERRAAAALERYRREYHRDAVVPRIVALYERVADESGGGPGGGSGGAPAGGSTGASRRGVRT